MNSADGFNFLFTRRLNQDPLENFFGVIRQNGGKCDNPYPLQFVRLFRQVCCRQLLTPSKGLNCELDLSVVLTSLSCTAKVQRNVACHVPCKLPNVVVAFSSVPPCIAVSCLEENAVYYVCGYLMR